MNRSDEAEAAIRTYIESRLDRYAKLRGRIIRSFLITLHSRGIASVDDIHRQAKTSSEPAAGPIPESLAENVQVGQRWNADQKSAIEDITLAYAAQAFSREDVDDLVNLTRKREEAQSLEEIANLPAVSFGLLAEKVKSFCSLPRGQTPLTAKESMSARVALIRKFISDQLEFIGVAKHFLRIRDFDDLIDRIIGSEDGVGLIGGKAGGLILGAKIIAQAKQKDPSAPDVDLHLPESFFLRSDVIEEFIQHNGLQHLQDQKYKSSDEIHNDFPMILDLIKNADFPRHIVGKIQVVLERIGSHPLIVRSSSLLEDRFGTAFAGKYRSVFVGNQGSPQQRLHELLGAIAEVYASIFHPDPISYRQRHNLIDYSENMGVLIQQLVGQRIGRYYLPVWSGVAVSHNSYRRNPRIRPEDGLARIVCGLGTRAVDRVATDFPRMIPLGLPTLRPEIKTEDIVRISQKEVDVIDLEQNMFVSVPLTAILDQNRPIPASNQVFSFLDHDFLRALMGSHPLGKSTDMVVTFDSWTRSSPYPAFLRWCLQTLAETYGCPMDIEFAYDGDRFYLLQCRPQATRKATPHVSLPTSIPDAQRIFTADRDIISAAVHGIEYLVLIDPRDYHAIGTDDLRIGVAQVVRNLNQRLADKSFILMGPGRWGSKDLRLGVRVGYSDINNTRILIEIARQQDGYLPEVSFGSHFFQDLVESDIHYLALYPDEAGSEFNEDFLHGATNALRELLPSTTGFQNVVKVIHVPAAAGGMFLNVDMDGENQEALAYLVPTASS